MSCPWKSEQLQLQNNKDLSFGRFQLLLHRFGNKPGMFENFDNVIDEQCVSGTIERVDMNSGHEDHMNSYIPHYDVVDETKPTNNARIIYDASVKPKSDNVIIQRTSYVEIFVWTFTPFPYTEI